jgi:L-asparaginase/Glu-tRNA(Gln) amidotransferase subunit D
MFIDRYILYTSIPFFIFIAILVNSVFQNYSIKIIAAIIFVGSMVFTFSLNPDNFRNMKEMVALVKRLKTKNTEVFIAPNYADLGFVYHYNIDYFKDYKNYKQLLKSEKIFPVSNEAETASALDTTLYKCIYIQAGSEFQDPDNKIYNYLSSKYKKVEHHKVFQIYLVHDFSN